MKNREEGALETPHVDNDIIAEIEQLIQHYGGVSKLAEKLGISKTPISNWRNGHRPVAVNRIVEIEKLYAEIFVESDLEVVLKQIGLVNYSKLHKKGYSLSEANLDKFLTYNHTPSNYRVRGKENIEYMLEFMTIDHDGTKAQFDEESEKLREQGISYLAFPSPSHINKLKLGQYRMRRVIPTTGLTKGLYSNQFLQLYSDLNFIAEGLDSTSRETARFFYPPIMDGVTEPKIEKNGEWIVLKPKPRNVTYEYALECVEAFNGNPYKAKTRFSEEMKAELSVYSGGRSDKEEVYFHDDKDFFHMGEGLGLYSELREKSQLEKIRCDCPFEGSEVHSDGLNGQDQAFIAEGRVTCESDTHGHLIGRPESENIADIKDMFLELEATDKQEKFGGYDFIYLDVHRAEYVFIKGTSITSLLKTKALLLVGKHIIDRVPKMSSIYNPSAKRYFVDDNGFNAYNTFKPSVFVEAHKEKRFHEIPEPIDFLLNHLVPDLRIKEVFINSLAYHLQTGKAIHLGWMFVGIEGAGKGILLDVIKKAFGSHNYEKIRLSAFTGDYVKGVPNKLIAHCDETIPYDKSKEVVDNLKMIIGNNTFSSRKMRTDHEEEKNYAMYFFSVNTFDLKLSSNDRRFNIIDCNKTLTSVVEDASKFRDKVLSGEIIQKFVNYLLEHTVDIKMTREIVNTEFRKKIITSKLSMLQRVAKAIVEFSLDELENVIDDSLEQLREDIEDKLLQLSECSRVKASLITELSKEIYKLVGGKDVHFKSHQVTSFLADAWIRDKMKVGQKTTFAYQIKEDGIHIDNFDLFNDLEEL